MALFKVNTGLREGHKAQHVTTHYSAPEIGALIEAAERVCELESRASPSISVVRPRA
jgi:hypothetical protein